MEEIASWSYMFRRIWMFFLAMLRCGEFLTIPKLQVVAKSLLCLNSRRQSSGDLFSYLIGSPSLFIIYETRRNLSSPDTGVPQYESMSLWTPSDAGSVYVAYSNGQVTQLLINESLTKNAKHSARELEILSDILERVRKTVAGG